jgi:hypothetical protein
MAATSAAMTIFSTTYTRSDNQMASRVAVRTAPVRA